MLKEERSAKEAFYRAAINFLLTGTNNLIGGQKFMFGMGSNVLSGTLSGMVSGALSGGIKGYKNAAAKGANRWTGTKYINTQDYRGQFKLGGNIQADVTKHCYAYALEYADQGHYNTPAQKFIDAVGGADGANMITTAQKVLGEKVSLYKSAIPKNGLDWSNIGSILENGSEVMGVISQGEKVLVLHGVNILNIRVADKLNLFGGGAKRVLRDILFRDPIKGALKNTRSFVKVEWMEY